MHTAAEATPLSVPNAEEVCLFAARRAVVSRQISTTLERCLQQLCQSDRRSIRNHAVKLAHEAVGALRAEPVAPVVA